MLPAGLDEAETAAFLLMEYGIWPYKEPLYELPPDLGGKILECLSLQTPHRDRMQAMVLDAVQNMAAALQNR